MDYLTITLLVNGLVVLVIGYRKNNRNVLLVSAILLLAAGALPEFIAGYQDGFNGASRTATASTD